METVFIASLALVIFAFVGYPIQITLLAGWKRKGGSYPKLDAEDLPEVTLLVAAYNEAEILPEKIQNSLDLNYPKEKLKILFVTDGSTDESMELLAKSGGVSFSHSPARKGKIAAINRIMPEISTAITVFTDANVMLNADALWSMVNHFQSNLVAAVSGEKVVLSPETDAASGTGEGAYWKYESYLKKKDAEWNTLVGSAGELVAIRTRLFSPTKEDTVIEDFVMTVGYALDGYQVAYEPLAVATEHASANVEEEEKRKIRISAGGIQAISRLPKALNPFHDPALTFQYISHRVLRWTLVPLALILLLVLNPFLIDSGSFFVLTFVGQAVFYGLTVLGYLFRNTATKWKLIYIPFYFTFMQVCVIRGWWRFFKGSQAVTWEKAKRAAVQTA
ncbi:glycosyltransferase family 2 protein [Algoriphagus namhaensis]|uniref:Glycosyltransferase family 2 protein n=1 Tax=Algoriphagus namhaensis TaxID=915353 RepID=A0ABV8ART1_9BACT